MRENLTECAAMKMVLSCERSPHSPKNVRVNDCKNTGDSTIFTAFSDGYKKIISKHNSTLSFENSRLILDQLPW